MLEKPYIKRDLLEKLIEWRDLPEFYAIKGPRQSGKTTLLKMLQELLIADYNVPFNTIHIITFEDEQILSDFKKSPVQYVERIVGSATPKERHYFFIDEFQYFKKGGKVLKLIYDTTKNIKCIITGSSSLEITEGLGAYMVGRLFSFNLLPLSFKEFLQNKEPEVLRSYSVISKAVNQLLRSGSYDTATPFFEDKIARYFEEFVLYGGYPAIVKRVNDKELLGATFREIVDNYLTKDIIKLLRITDTETFYTIVKLLAYEIGNLILYDSLARDAHSYFKEIKHYMGILEETYILERISPYYKSKITELKKNPKVYFVDTGLRNFVINNFLPFEKRSDVGALVENFVFSEFKKNLPDEMTIKYWRTEGKAEVDFIIDAASSRIPVEVKYTSFKKPKISKSYRSFIDAYKPDTGLVLTRNFWGEMAVQKTKVYFIPVWYV